VLNTIRLLIAVGPWEQMFSGECDGNRRRPVLVAVIGE
jgi:hypothetical protein